MYNSLQCVTQGNRSVDYYYKELETIATRLQVQEDSETTMARFLGGLRREIANIVELHEYEDLMDMYHKAQRVEKQLKTGSQYSSNSSTPWRNSWPKKDTSKEVKPNVTSSGSKLTNSCISNFKGTKPKAARDITCFKCQGKGHYMSQCPNSKVMVVRDGKIVSDDENDYADMPPLKGDSEDECEIIAKNFDF